MASSNKPERLSAGMYDLDGDDVEELSFADLAVAAGETYFLWVGSCAPPQGNYRIGIGLREDETEPNDGFAEYESVGNLVAEVPVNLAGDISGSACDWFPNLFLGTAMVDDLDIFHFTPLQTGTLSAVLDWDGDADTSDMDLVIFDDQGIVVGTTDNVLSFAGASSGGKPEVIPSADEPDVVTLEAGRDYFAGVFYCDHPAGTARYRLNLTLEQ
jgi:hypothetical protein